MTTEARNKDAALTHLGTVVLHRSCITDRAGDDLYRQHCNEDTNSLLDEVGEQVLAWRMMQHRCGTCAGCCSFRGAVVTKRGTHFDGPRFALYWEYLSEQTGASALEFVNAKYMV
jgi:hypothetical protein